MQICYDMGMSEVKEAKLRSSCPINFVVETLGDKWSLLILRDTIFYGKHTHGEFLRSNEGIATNILADRLSMLERRGFFIKIADPSDKRRDIYTLSEKGLGLIPLLLDAVVWSNSFGPTFLTTSKVLSNDFEKDRKSVITTITQVVRRGGFVFENKRWAPEDIAPPSATPRREESFNLKREIPIQPSPAASGGQS